MTKVVPDFVLTRFCGVSVVASWVEEVQRNVISEVGLFYWAHTPELSINFGRGPLCLQVAHGTVLDSLWASGPSFRSPPETRGPGGPWKQPLRRSTLRRQQLCDNNSLGDCIDDLTSENCSSIFGLVRLFRGKYVQGVGL